MAADPINESIDANYRIFANNLVRYNYKVVLDIGGTEIINPNGYYEVVISRNATRAKLENRNYILLTDTKEGLNIEYGDNHFIAYIPIRHMKTFNLDTTVPEVVYHDPTIETPTISRYKELSLALIGCIPNMYVRLLTFKTSKTESYVTFRVV
tara:strand:+ start:12874 stop:13332 length:459 start_codon:yes stop_codon:yes gene_type:complete